MTAVTWTKSLIESSQNYHPFSIVSEPVYLLSKFWYTHTSSPLTKVNNLILLAPNTLQESEQILGNSLPKLGSSAGQNEREQDGALAKIAFLNYCSKMIY